MENGRKTTKSSGEKMRFAASSSQHHEAFARLGLQVAATISLDNHQQPVVETIQLH
jgi:hypothetical protein